MSKKEIIEQIRDYYDKLLDVFTATDDDELEDKVEEIMGLAFYEDFETYRTSRR